ncbi:MAG: CoA activase [Planctomycetota bacterium]|nr:MAG: CoA activase [Planctomycetota bacterium]
MNLGLDIGSVSVNAVLMDDENNVIDELYLRTKGQPVETSLEAINTFLERHPNAEIKGVALTGSGGKLMGRILNAGFVNEIVAQSKATGTLYPEVKTIIEIGGEDSKLILLERDEDGSFRVKDFAMNTVCAAGTGSFLDQQAKRLGVNIEGEFAELALKSERPPRIAGRCSVFAKTDMIHLQQEGTPDYDIVAGLCYALTRNYVANIGRGKDFDKPIAFQGGVAANRGIIKAFEDVLGMEPGELIIPKHYASMGAIGAVLTLREKGEMKPFAGVEAIEGFLRNRTAAVDTLKPLVDKDYEYVLDTEEIPAGEKVDAFVGVDVGSISTNVLVMDRNKRILARRYLMTAGRPLKAVTRGLYEVGQEIGDRVIVKGCATTGSGRYLSGEFIGADIVKNEITAHATGAIAIDPEVDTIFEIGGQDSKYISIDNGAVVDFTMNKVCAAGTGSFLEEQAEKLGISIKDEFGKMALGARQPAHLGERCTVFMESDLNHHQQKGVSKENLVGGLCYSIVFNYLNRVVEDRRIGDKIFFQGGTAFNRGVKAAFEAVTGKPIIIPPHQDLMGAYGCAIIAMEHMAAQGPDAKSRFKSFDLTKKKYTMTSFECKGCSNRCEIRRVSVEGEKPLYYGSRCGKYDEESKHSKGKNIPRLFAEREKMLLNAYPKDKPDLPNGKTVGIPRCSLFFDLYPFWKAFFTELGYQVVLSDETNRDIIDVGSRTVTSETCLPIKVGHGHVMNLLDKGVDYIFLPMIINMDQKYDGLVHSYACPYIQALPYLVKTAIDIESRGAKLLEPVIHMELGRDEIVAAYRGMGKKLGLPLRDVKRALNVAFERQEKFESDLVERGREVMANIPEGAIAMVIVSRPYNGCDTRLNLNIPEKLRDMGCLAIPLDFLPIDMEAVARDNPHMYWKYGQKILGAGRIIRDDPRLNAIYITNFGCGPDSFISKFFARELGGKPFLTIEVDEHSADVGAITRCEAFLDSLKSVKKSKRLPPARVKEARNMGLSKNLRIYIPYMDDHGYVLAACMRHYGVDAVAMPMADSESMELGRKYTSGKECYPCIITTGDIISMTRRPDFDPERSGFFMPTAFGPCRFGQYNKFHRMVLDDLGYKQVPMIVFDQTADYHSDLETLGTDFKRYAWSAILLVDIMQKLLREARPYEVTKGEADAVYEQCLGELQKIAEQKGDVFDFARKVMDRFRAVEVDRSHPKPRIGIVGEIFVRSNQFTNNFIMRRLEAFGCEVTLPAFEEWLNYISFERVREAKNHRNYKNLAVEYVSNLVQKRDADKLNRPFAGNIRNFEREVPIDDVLRYGSRYIDIAFRGETILSMGKAVEYAHAGYNGIVNLVPFACLPGHIVNALFTKFSRDYPGLPVLKMDYDGTKQANEDTRIEAFVHQARQHMETQLASEESLEPIGTR